MTKQPLSPIPPPPATVADCQQQLLAQLKSGHYALSSADKEGSRLLCYYQQAFLAVEVGEDGTSLRHLPHEQQVVSHLWRSTNYKLVQTNGQYTWSYDLTEAEQLERWHALLARLTAFSDSNKQFVKRVLAEFAALLP